MRMQEGLGALGLGTAERHGRAYFLDLLGGSHHGLGRYQAACQAELAQARLAGEARDGQPDRSQPVPAQPVPPLRAGGRF